MTEFEKVPCEYCGELVSMHHKSQEAHMKKCKMKPEMNETKVVEKQVVEQKPSEKTMDMTGVEAKGAEMYKIAMKARETRKESPEVFVAGMSTDERKELVKRYAKDCVDPRYDPTSSKPREYAPMHACWSTEAKAMIFAHRSYEPVFNEHKEQVQHEGDLLFKIPREMWMDVVNAESNQSSIMRNAATDDETEAIKAGAGTNAEFTAERSTEELN